MKCSNCGKQNPDANKFCTYCGAPCNAYNINQPLNNSSNVPAAAPVVQQSSGKTPQNKTRNIAIALVVMAVVGAIGFFASKQAAENHVKNSSGGSDSNYAVTADDETTTRAANPAYEAVFDGTYIVHYQSFFMMDTASFAKKDSNGVISCADYGYKNDEVKELVITTYIPIAEFSAAQKSQLEKEMRNELRALEGKSAITVNYNMGADYFRVTQTFTGIDVSSNRAQMVEAGVININAPLSMANEEKDLIAEGFLKK